MQDERVLLKEPGQSLQRLAERLAGFLVDPAGPGPALGAAADSIPGALRDLLACHQRHLANAALLQPVEGVDEERAVRDGDERRRDPASTAPVLPCEHYCLRGRHI